MRRRPPAKSVAARRYRPKAASATVRTSHAYGSSGAVATATSVVQSVPASYRPASSSVVNGPPSRRRSSSSIARVTRSSARRWSGGASSRRRSPSCHCGSAFSNGTRPRLLQPLDHVGLLPRLDHPEAARLALERGRVAQLPPALAQAGVLDLQRGDLGPLAGGLAVGRDPGGGRADVQVEDEAEDRDQCP